MSCLPEQRPRPPAAPAFRNNPGPAEPLWQPGLQPPGLRPRRATAAWARTPLLGGTGRGAEGPRGPKPPRGGGKSARVRDPPRRTRPSRQHRAGPSAGARTRHLPPRRHPGTSTPARPAACSPSASHVVRSCPPRHAGTRSLRLRPLGAAGARRDCEGRPLGEPTGERRGGERCAAAAAGLL